MTGPRLEQADPHPLPIAPCFLVLYHNISDVTCCNNARAAAVRDAQWEYKA